MKRLNEQEIVNAQIEINRAEWAMNLDEKAMKKESSFKTEHERRRYIMRCVNQAMQSLKKV